jgi:hypothetical protein
MIVKHRLPIETALLKVLQRHISPEYRLLIQDNTPEATPGSLRPGIINVADCPFMPKHILKVLKGELYCDGTGLGITYYRKAILHDFIKHSFLHAALIDLLDTINHFGFNPEFARERVTPTNNLPTHKAINRYLECYLT